MTYIGYSELTGRYYLLPISKRAVKVDITADIKEIIAFNKRPLPPPVAEERDEKMWLDIVHSVFAGYELMKTPIEVAQELQKRFNITKK